MEKKTDENAYHQKCTCCRKQLPISKFMVSDKKYSTCKSCRVLSAKKRLAAKNKIKYFCNAIKPNKEKCINKASPDLEHRYCIKHKNQLVYEKDPPGTRRCTSHYSCEGYGGLRAILNESENIKCTSCLEKENNKDRTVYQEIILNNECAMLNESDKLQCIDCKEICDIDEMHEFRGKHTNRCKMCIYKQRIVESKRIRDPEKRKETSRNYENQPEVKKRRKEYRLAHPELYRLACKLSRERKKKRDPVKYYKERAEYKNKYYRSHPEIYKRETFRRKTMPRISYSVHRRRCNRDSICDFLTFDEYVNLVHEKCYYCGYKHEIYLNGIDRIDSNDAYYMDNCVTCCKMCNMMKNTTNKETFILMCVHIANYKCTLSTENDKTFPDNSRFFPEVFNNFRGCCYSDYKARAIRMNKDFEITKEQFQEIIKRPCYLCGKETKKGYHGNGVDHVNNNEGYTLKNCESCCGNCNYMKRDYDIWDFIYQCNRVAINHIEELKDLRKKWTVSFHHIKNHHKFSISNVDRLSYVEYSFVDEENFDDTNLCYDSDDDEYDMSCGSFDDELEKLVDEKINGKKVKVIKKKKEPSVKEANREFVDMIYKDEYRKDNDDQYDDHRLYSLNPIERGIMTQIRRDHYQEENEKEAAQKTDKVCNRQQENNDNVKQKQKPKPKKYIIFDD